MSIENDATLSPDDFVQHYGPAAAVNIGGRAMTLGQALQMEALFCTAEPTRRQEPTARLGYLARMLAEGGSLEPAHQYLIPEPGS